MVKAAAGAAASADLYLRSVIVWEEHWRQRLSLGLARGHVKLMLGAMATAQSSSAGDKGRKASPKWSTTDC